MRIAWLGPVSEGGGVAGMGRVLMEGLLHLGVEVDYFTTAKRDTLPSSLQDQPNLTLRGADCGWDWEWNRWYNKTNLSAFISSAVSRRHNYNKLSELVAATHRTRRYDVIFQLSQQELFKLGRLRDRLPPIVIYPCSHAAGELRWHRRESRFALKHERRAVHAAVRSFLRYRTGVQRRELTKPTFILGPSRRFNELLHQDYGVDTRRMAVLRHPLLLSTAAAGPTQPLPVPTGPIRLLAVMRISVRKGLEELIRLSHALNDLAGKVKLDIAGGASLWSDYRGHLASLNPNIATYIGDVPYRSMQSLYDQSDVLLVPSRYEPGSLAVGEALSRGVSIVASDEVGPAEVLSTACCRTFPVGNYAQFEAAVRDAVKQLSEDRTGPRKIAVQEAWEQFAPDKICRQLADVLENVSRRGSATDAAAAGVAT